MITAAHDNPETIWQVELIMVEDVLYGGQGVLLRNGQLWHEPGSHPAYFKMAQDLLGQEHGLLKKWIRGAFKSDVKVLKISEPAIGAVHGHWNFGHFLLEILPRQLILDRECPKDWPILLARSGPSFLPGMVQLVCPDRQIVTFDAMTEVVSAPALISCGDLISQVSYIPDLKGLLLDLRARLLHLADPSGLNAPRVYLSRRGVRSKRHAILKPLQIERAAMLAGYTVVRPAELSFPDQVRLFAGARIIAGEYGSALHNAIFADQGTTIIDLNWINPYQSQIANLMGHRIGYLPPQDGEFRHAASLKGDKGLMTFSPGEVYTVLKSEGNRADPERAIGADL